MCRASEAGEGTIRPEARGNSQTLSVNDATRDKEKHDKKMNKDRRRKEKGKVRKRFLFKPKISPKV